MRDDASPSDVAGHVAYEIKAMATFCRRAGEVRGKDWIAFMEASLLHARCLLEFLFKDPENVHAGDIRPDHLVDGWIEEPENEEYVRYKDFINRHVLHLTVGRVPKPEPEREEEVPELEAVNRFVLSRMRELTRLPAHDETAMVIIRSEIVAGTRQLDEAPELASTTSTSAMSVTTLLPHDGTPSPGL